MKDRIRKIRKEKGLTQPEFGEKLGISRDAIANLEYGRVEPSQAIIKLICNEFSVNRVWLETGEGEMFAKKSTEDIFIEYMPKILAMEDGDFAKEFITILMQLEPEHWKLIEDFARKVIEKTDKAKKED